MKLNRLSSYFVTLGVFLMLTVAVVAGQARATEQRLLAEFQPVVKDVAGQVLINATLRLDDNGTDSTLTGHE